MFYYMPIYEVTICIHYATLRVLSYSLVSNLLLPTITASETESNATHGTAAVRAESSHAGTTVRGGDTLATDDQT